jgi:hypothetical protein
MGLTWKPTVAFFVATILAGSRILAPFFSYAEDRVIFPIAAFERGMVTDIRSTSIEIDGRMYSLKTGVVVVNEQGREIELGSVVPQSEVKFHVKEGQIDKLLVILPQ